MEGSYIKVNLAKAEDNKLVFNLCCSQTVKKYFKTDTFYVEYDKNVEINAVDTSILNIPAVATIITVAWAVGADVYVNELDKNYIDSLAKIKFVFKEFYPQFSCVTDLYVNKVVSNQFNNEKQSNYGLLFSAGLDSLTSFVRHKDKNPELLTIWGADIPICERDFWEKVKKQINLFGNSNGVNTSFIKSNVRQLLNSNLLARDYKVSGWWGSIYHSLILLGLVAPLTVIKGIGTVLIAATHTRELKGPWGSHPLIDNNIAWADVKVVHDGYELSRQEKLKYLIKHSPKSLSHLRVCYSSHSRYNCGRCEKCLRTITALILEGEDPNNYNFDDIDEEKILLYIKDSLIKGRFHIEVGARMWKDIQSHIPSNFIGKTKQSTEFFTWLKDFDFSKYKESKFQRYLGIISRSIAEDGVKKTIRMVLNFIIRRLRKSYV